MSVYTVHQPPLQSTDDVPDGARFAFVRDGFSFWSFLIAPLWMLWHRMWLVLVGYLVVTIGLEAVLTALGASQVTLVVVGVIIALLVGLEASTLRRFTLRRRRWTNVGIVSGDDLEGAERRFFDAWLHSKPQRASASIPTRPIETPAAAMPQSTSSGVIGLFPEPGVRR
jgi:hypothetical protein